MGMTTKAQSPAQRPGAKTLSLAFLGYKALKHESAHGCIEGLKRTFER
jgi:hypothetical protein